MLLEFSIKNYRSIKDNVVFSMEAESSKSKSDNVFSVKLKNGEDIRLLKSAVLYGANASGKSNVLRSFHYFLALLNSGDITAGQSIWYYDPFIFDTKSDNVPTEYNISFIDTEGIKYNYSFAFTQKEIIYENLISYPNGREKTLFTRNNSKIKDNIIHTVNIGAESKNKTIDVFSNKLALQMFGTEYPIPDISKVFVFLKKFRVLNIINLLPSYNFFKEINELIYDKPHIINKLSRLINFADTRIDKILINRRKEAEFNIPEGIPEKDRMRFIDKNLFNVQGIHKKYDKGKYYKDQGLPLSAESRGTNTLYILGGLILYTLEEGGVLMIDEMNTSLHPFLTKLLVMLFHNQKINPKNAQLIFTTHDTNLLDNTLFRKDQVWFSEIDEFGATDLYSLKEIEGVREDTPFDKWYMAGKFGALPSLESLEELF